MLPLLLALLPGVAPTQEPGPPGRPNVILCMADDLGVGDLGVGGHPVLRTPALDDMARGGLRLTRFHAAAPVCSPTRGSVLTGRHPNRFGCFQWGHWIRPEEVTLAEVLQQHGYRTGHFGKWHLGPLDPASPAHPGASGFDTWVSAPNFFDLDPRLSHDGRVRRHEGEGSALVMDAALRFLEDCQERGQPFLAVIWFASPHDPHQATAEERAPYADQPVPAQHYYGEVAALDRAMGRLRAALAERGLERNTLLWFTSDNGARAPGSNGRLRGEKGTLFEGGLRVPCFLTWPGVIDAGGTVALPAGTVDVMPTVLGLLNIDPPKGVVLDGEDLGPWLRGDPRPRQRPLGFWSYPAGGVACRSERELEAIERRQQADAPAGSFSREAPERTRRHPEEDALPGWAAWLDGSWKLHHHPGGEAASKVLLFDLATDPAEQRDLAQQEPERVRCMLADLQAWQRAVLADL